MCFSPQPRPLHPRKPSEQTLEGIRKSILLYTPNLRGTLDLWDVIAHACGTLGVTDDPELSQEGVDRTHAIETAIEQMFKGRYDEKHLHRHVLCCLWRRHHNYMMAHGRQVRIPREDYDTPPIKDPTPETHPDRYIRPLKRARFWWLKLLWSGRY